MKNGPFLSEIKYTLRYINLKNADPSDPVQRYGIEVHDTLKVEKVEKEGIRFVAIRNVSADKGDLLSFEVAYVAFLDFSETYSPADEHDAAYWEDYLKSHPEYSRAMFALASSIISNVTLTYGERNPIITPPGYICENEPE